jgi:thiamine-phosphate pyrophosphorylase
MTSPSVPTASVSSPEAPAPHSIGGQPPTAPLGLDRPALLVVSDGQGDLGAIRRLGQAAAGQAWGFYLREPALPAHTLCALAIELTALGLRVLIADRVDLALASGAFGVELGERSLPVARVRAWVGRRLYLGRSVHDLARARAAADDGADWLLFGQVYPSPSKPSGQVAGIASLRADRCGFRTGAGDRWHRDPGAGGAGGGARGIADLGRAAAPDPERQCASSGRRSCRGRRAEPEPGR